MQIQSVMGGRTPSFSGHKEMDQIAAQYAKTDADKKLVAQAKDAYSIKLDITGDGVYIDKKDNDEAQTFLSAAKESKNGKLAFLLVNDIRKPFRLLDTLSYDIRKTMVEIASKSKDVTKQDVIDYLV